MHDFFFENLRNPAHNRRAGLMRQFSSGQLYSIAAYLDLDKQQCAGRTQLQNAVMSVYIHRAQ
jgi:hypothetical protein